MDYAFKDWQDALNEFKASIEKDISEIRKQKLELQNLRSELKMELGAGKYIRDDQRIILSAPEIIIGNVDKSGELMNGGSSVVVIRGGDVKLQGVGAGGSVITKAPRIMNFGVDPGTDGMEEVAASVSEIIFQSGAIALHANSEKDVFSSGIALPKRGGLALHADTVLSVEANIKGDTKKKNIENLIDNLEKEKKTLKTEADDYKSDFEGWIKKVEELSSKHENFMDTEELLRAEIFDLFDLNEDFRMAASSLINVFINYTQSISRLAEVSRKINVLKKQKDEVKTGSSYTKEPTGCKVNIEAERIDLISLDGEGNQRDSANAMLNLMANRVALSSLNKDGSLSEKGEISLTAKNIGLSTIDATNVKFDNDGKLTQGDYKASGDISIKSKNISLESVDYEVKENKLAEKELTKSGKLSIRFENVDISNTDSEGKATGEISMNSKSITMKSMDLDKEKSNDKSLATGSTMLLLSEKMFVGGKDKDTESKLVQTASENIGTFAKSTFEVQQGEKKTILQMDGGKMSISGDSSQIYGKTTINDATEIKGELKAPKAAIDNVEAKSSFKSPNISDGMSVGAGGGGASLSSKLEKEQIQNDNKK